MKRAFFFLLFLSSDANTRVDQLIVAMIAFSFEIFPSNCGNDCTAAINNREQHFVTINIVIISDF